MRPTHLVALLGSASALALGFACGDPYAGEAPASEPTRDAGDASDAGTTPPDGSTGPSDAAAEAASGIVPFAGCQARAPTCAIAACERRVLYVPVNGAEYPFAIATDATHVYWMAQSGGSTAYNGEDPARVMRTMKDGSTPAGEIVVAAQPRATAIAVANGWIYWAARLDPDAAVSAPFELRRVPASCTAPCAPEPIAKLRTDTVSRIVVLTPTLVLVAHRDGDLERVDLVTKAVTLIGNIGFAPSTAATRDAVFVGSVLSGVVRGVPRTPNATLGATLTLPVTDAGAVGTDALGATCTHVMVVRDDAIYRADDVNGGTFARLGTITNRDWFDGAADEGFFYVASANTGGVTAVASTTGATALVTDGNVFDIATDDDGVYWGDHATSTGGALWRMLK